MTAEPREVARRIGTDLATVGLRDGFGVYSLAGQDWVHAPERGSTTVPEGFEGDGYVAVLLGAQHLVDVSGGSPLPAWVEVLSFVQDCATDELGFGWPEAYEDGRFLAVLQPAVHAGDLVWLSRGTPLAPVGRLSALRSGTIKNAPAS
jgi:hypothetical protein